MTGTSAYESLHNHTTASDGTQTYAEVLATAERTKTAWTIGIDGHREVDIERFAADRKLAPRTEGQTKRFIDKFNPNLDWTNFLS